MNKCKSCLWATHINEQVSICLFPTCVKLNGWASERCGANDNRAHTNKETRTAHVDREGMDKGLSMRGEDKLPEQDMSVLP